MTQIYKVAHLKNNEIETLYVFYGSKIEGVEYDSEKLKERFESDKNDILFKDIFAENLLDEIINKDIKVVFVDMKIHLDDTIENIKTKMLYATGGNTFSFVEMYLFVKRSIQHYPEKIYENLTQNGSFDLLRLHMEQFLHNINRPELMDTIGIKETYDYDDIINLKLTDEKYTTNKSIDQKIVVKDTNYPYFVNPYDITEVGRLLDDSQENMTTTTNNHILMNFGEFENDIIYMCTTEDVIDYTNAKNLSEESCIKIYYPKLYDKNITSIKILETNKESLLFASKNMISDRFKVIEYNINLMNDVHTSKGSVMTKYNKKGVTSLDFIIHPFTPFNLPLDVVFKLINTTEDVALTKYNPGKSQEKMYRLHTAYTATNGKKIPTLSKQEIFKNMKEIGKSKSVSVHVKYEYNGEYRTLICQFISNGDINIKIDGFIEVVDIDTTIKGPINNIIDKVRGYISQGGYNMNNFNSIDDTNIEVNNIDYRLELPVNRRLDVESLNKCISGVFIVSNFNISKGIEMRYKRVDNYTEMLAEEALIIDLHNKGLNHDIVIENLISNFNLTKKDAVAKFTDVYQTLDFEQNDSDNNKLKIKINPGLKILITKDNSNNISIEVYGINNYNYLETVGIYLDAFIKITQNPDLISGCKNIENTSEPDIEPDTTTDLISEAEQINMKTNIKDGAIQLEEEEDGDDGAFGDEESDEDDTQGEVSGGADKTQGYDIDLENLKLRDYFADRLKARDKNLFMVKGEGNINSYSRSCPSVHRRQPVILTDAEKDKIDREQPGSYGEALQYGSSPDKKHWYICPRYWSLKDNTSLTQEKAESGDYGGIIPLKSNKISPGETIFEFKSNKQMDPGSNVYKQQYPGFLKKSNGVCAPCCFGGPKISKAQLERRKICNNDIETNQNVQDPVTNVKPTQNSMSSDEPDEDVDVPAIKPTKIKLKTKAKKTNVKTQNVTNYYIKGPDKFPIDNNRFGYLPVSIERFLNTSNKKCYISDTNTNLKQNQPCILRLGVEANNSQSFISCIAKVWANSNGGGVDNSPSIDEMKNIMINSIDYDVFVGLQNGNLINIFAQANADSNVVELDKLKQSNIYKKLKSDDPDKIKFFNKVVSAYGNFIKFLQNPTVTIDHTYLWDLICKPNPKLFVNGLNMVILDIPNDDMTDKVDVMCPSSNYSDDFFNVKKDTIMLIRKTEGKNKNDNIFFELIGEMVEGDTNKEISTRIRIKGDKFKDIKETINTIQKAYSKCGGLNSKPGVYTFKRNIALPQLIRYVEEEDYTATAQIFNYDGKVIAIKVEKDGKGGILPCYPSAPMVDLGKEGKEVEYIWINSITGVSYADTIDFLLSIKQKNEKILSKPMIKVAEDGKIVGVITETNQFVPVDPEVITPENNKGVEKTITSNNFNDIDTMISNESNVDIERIDYIKKINLETGFYKIFRNTIRIMLSEHNNRGRRSEIEKIIESEQRHNTKLRGIIKLLRTMTNNYFSFTEFDDALINDINNVSSCYKTDTDKDKTYCIIDDTTNENINMLIPKKNLINELDNEKIYFAKLADELLRFNRIKTFIFEPKSFLSLGDIGYNLGDDEIVLMQSLLTKEYFEDAVKEETNEHVNTNTYDNVNPQSGFKYSSSYNIEDLEQIKSDKKTNKDKTNEKTKTKTKKLKRKTTLKDN
jgi:hypothetical protein